MEIEIAVIVGWVILISSWILPSFIKESSKKTFVGLSLSALATGIFIGHLLTIIF
jgi:type III secretory pathway component EscT